MPTAGVTVQRSSTTPSPETVGNAPVAVCKNATIYVTAVCGGTASIDNGSSDPDGDLVGCTQSPAGPYPIGTTAVTLTCTDSTGLSASCTGNVKVMDLGRPTVHVTPTSQTVQCARGSSYSYLNGVTAEDLCEGSLPSSSISWTGTVNPGQVGSSTVAYQAHDSANNASFTVSRTVNVVDTLPPTLSLLGSPNMPVECGSTFNDPGTLAIDVCLGPITASVVRSGSVNTSVVGAYALTYNVTDGYNAAAPAHRTVSVVDTRQPTVTLNGPTSLVVECGGEYWDPGATATDSCAGNLPVSATGELNLSVPGTYVTQYQATDPSGNVGTASQNRVVTVSDTLPPTVALNGAASMALECGTPFTDPGATANDQCAGSLPLTVSGGVNAQQPGVQTITYTANDGHGHSASRTRTVAVSDTQAPSLSLLGPDFQALECNGSPYVDLGAVASDSCSGDLTGSITTTSDLNQSAPGDYTISYRVQDASGNVSTATRHLTVGPCTECFSVQLADYTLFLQNNYTGGHDVLGKVAAGGNIELTDFSVGARVPDANIANTLVSGGDLSLSRGAVWGDASYGGSYSADASVTYTRGTAAHGTPIDFAARFAELKTLSGRLAALPAQGETTLTSWGGIFLHGADPALNVFDVSASSFTGASLWSIDAPAGSLVVVNIHGASASFTGFGTFFSGGIDQHGVLYNFVDATSINAQGFGFWGTVLAPKADISFSNGSWDGGIYAKSLTGNAEGHINPLNDHSICP